MMILKKDDNIYALPNRSHKSAAKKRKSLGLFFAQIRQITIVP